MKKKIVGIFLMMLMIFATIIPVATSLNINKTNTEKSNLKNIEPLVITSFPAFADSYITTNYPSANFGNDETLWVTDYQGPWTDRSFLFFDLSSIPVGTTINHAELFLYFWNWDDDGIYEIGVYRVTNSWSELGITWNHRDISSSIPWTNPGGDYDPTPIDSIFLDKPIPPSFVSWDVTTLVQDWVNGVWVNYGLMLKCVSETGGMPMKMKIFYSSEWGTSTERPYLEVDYVTSRNREINTPFLQFLKGYLYQFPILQKLLQRLGL